MEGLPEGPMYVYVHGHLLKSILHSTYQLHELALYG